MGNIAKYTEPCPNVNIILRKWLLREYRSLPEARNGGALRIVDVLGTLPQAIAVAKCVFPQIEIVPTEEDYQAQFTRMASDEYEGKTIFLFAPHFTYKDWRFAYRVLARPCAIFFTMENYSRPSRVLKRLICSGRAKFFRFYEKRNKCAQVFDAVLLSRLDHFEKMPSRSDELTLSGYREETNT